MLNAFKAKRKFSAFGIMSSTGRTGLYGMEGSNYGNSSDDNESLLEDESMRGSNNDYITGGHFWGEGFPRSWAGGGTLF